MNANIRFTGLTYQPSDYDCPDGTFDYITNAINDNGCIQPLQEPNIIAVIDANIDVDNQGFDALCIHDNRYILLFRGASGTGNLLWVDKSNLQTPLKLNNFPNNSPHFSKSDILNVTSLGNTLIILTNEKKHYFIWKTDSYKYLGSHLPELTMSFGLQGELIGTLYDKTNKYFNDITDIYASEVDLKIREDQIEYATQAILAKVNLFIAEEATKKGRFLFPFFIRFAYRLYDQSLTMHSAPILLTPSTFCAPLVNAGSRPTDHGVWEVLDIAVNGFVTDLYYVAIGDNNIFDGWEDIIKSIDIFISEPIYSYKQSGKVESISIYNRIANSYGEMMPASLLKGKGFDSKIIETTHTYTDLLQVFAETHKLNGQFALIDIPLRDKKEIIEDIKSVSKFYLLKSFYLDELKFNQNQEDFNSTCVKVDIPEDYLSSLQTREVMTDDYMSHDDFTAKCAYQYNSRINYANILKKHFRGFDLRMFQPETEIPDGNFVTLNARMFVQIDEPTGTIYKWIDTPFTSNICYLFYPNPNARYIYVKIESPDGSHTMIKFELEQSNFLNGAFWFDGWSTENYKHGEWSIPTEDKSVAIANKIYTSEVNNPLLIPIKGVNTIGATEIVGIKSAAKALSESQFGQFPLYAFTKEGIWAMSVKDDGWFYPEQPISQEVCVNPKSITQMDSSVIFATDKGLMIIEGSNVGCISKELDSLFPFSLECLPKCDALLNVYGKNIPKETINHIDYIREANLLYDYRHQHIHVYNPNYDYGYVFSLKSKIWTQQTQTKIMSTFNAIPEAQAIVRRKVKTNDKVIEMDVLVDFSNNTSSLNNRVLMITRPFKLGAPDIYKTIDNILIRGIFKENHVKQVLYGSRDYVNWVVVYSSNNARMHGIGGTPYKAFRLAVIADLDNNESISEATINYDTKYTTKHR